MTGLLESTTYQYRVRATNGIGTSANSNTISVTTSVGAPTIASFSPITAATGTVVNIIGTGFGGASNVSFGGIAASSFTVVSATSINATVGLGASGSVSVTTVGGTGTRAGFTFIPAPTVTGFTPASGGVGTSVTITGTNFSPTPANNIVKFNNTTSVVTASSTTSITTSVPTGATTGLISVTVSGQTATSSTSFTFIPPPTISSFSPTNGIIGATVTITGTNFSPTPANNTVTFNGVPSVVTASTATSITTSVPAGATIGPIRVTVAGQIGVSASNFTPPPLIASFSPVSGAINSIITITGSNFNSVATNNTVRFNGVLATVTNVTATSLTVTVPSATTTGKISVINSGLTGESSSEFTLLPVSVASFAPVFGALGSSVTITGTGFSSVNSNNIVKFNNVTAVVTNSTPTTITATVPAGSTTGKITVAVNGILATSTDDFGGTLSVTSFSPVSSTTGGSVTITGTSFSATPTNQTIKFDGVTALITSSTTTSLVVTVPTGATTGKITVTRDGATASSPSEFLVLPLAISTFSPSIGAIGSSVTISGSGFSSVNANNLVEFNDIEAVVTNSSPTSLTAIVPAGNVDGKISVTINGTTAFSDNDFSGTLSISSFSPINALEGASVVIAGAGFSSTASDQVVKFNNTVASITAANKTNLTVTVPSGATTGKISIEREGIVVTSSNEFLVLPLTISAFSPGIGDEGTQVTILGTGFSSVNENNVVTFNGISAVVTNSTPTTITATVPGGNTVGKISVTINGTTATSADDFGGTLSISSFTPNGASADEIITINGTGFSATPINQTVKFNGISATVASSNLTSLSVKVPPEATTGKINVIRDGVTVESDTEFVALPLAIDSFTPKIGLAGSIVTLQGSGFSSVPTNNIVMFNNVEATVLSSTALSIQVSVPVGVNSGKISVTVNNIFTESNDEFKITKLIITQTSYPDFFTVGDAGLNVSVTVNDINEVGSIIFKSRGITAAEDVLKIETVPVSSISNTIVYQIPAAHFNDPLGLYSWFILTDKEGSELITEPKHTYLNYPATASQQEIPNLKFGKDQASYNLISIPLNLADASALRVFDELGVYDNRKWRLYELINGNLIEEPKTILSGKGYWLIAATETRIYPGGGSTMKVTKATPYKLKLNQGWNLIGNPYDFAISWNDVLNHNMLTPELLKIRQYINGAVVSEPTLNRYRGAYIDSDIARDIEIPVINRSLSGGRVASTEKNSLAHEDWVVNFSVDDGYFRNELFGFGMNPSALETLDIYDDISIPLLAGISSFEMAFRYGETEKLIADIVPTTENYSWQSQLKAERDVILQWDNTYFGDNDRHLVLENASEVDVIDMRSTNQINLRSGIHTLRFHYGDINFIKDKLIEKESRVGFVYPNPINRTGGIISIALSLPEGQNEVTLELRNSLSVSVTSPNSTFYQGGRQIVSWQTNLDQLAQGFYLVKISVKDRSGAIKESYQRIILE